MNQGREDALASVPSGPQLRPCPSPACPVRPLLLGALGQQTCQGATVVVQANRPKPAGWKQRKQDVGSVLEVGELVETHKRQKKSGGPGLLRTQEEVAPQCAVFQAQPPSAGPATLSVHRLGWL